MSTVKDWTTLVNNYINNPQNSQQVRANLASIRDTYNANVATAQANLEKVNGILVDNPTSTGADVSAIKASLVKLPKYNWLDTDPTLKAFGSYTDLNAYISATQPYITDLTGDNINYDDSSHWYVSLNWAANTYYSKEGLLKLTNYFNKLSTNSSLASEALAALTAAQTQAPMVQAAYAKVKAQATSIKNSLDLVNGKIVTDYVKKIEPIIANTKGGSPKGLSFISGTTTQTAAKPKGPTIPSSDGSQNVLPPKYPPTAEFNLPPHNWSLPLRPKNVESLVSSAVPDDNLRRGRFWHYADSQQQLATSASSSVTTQNNPGKSNQEYGFQFLWNPSDYSTSVTLNPDVTPGSSQYWSTALPVFPSGEVLSVSIVLDRVNDFACFASVANDYITSSDILSAAAAATQAGLQAVPSNDVVGTAVQNYLSTLINIDKAALAGLQDDFVGRFQQYYANSGTNTNDKIADLMRRGTYADLEYIYKCVNGDGWVRLDQTTSDIGFLAMTLVEIEIGPMRYLGYLNNLNVDHQMFSEMMVPIRTQVDLQFQLMASASVAQNQALSTTTGATK